MILIVILTAIHEKHEYSLQHLATPKDSNSLQPGPIYDLDTANKPRWEHFLSSHISGSN